MQVVFALLVDYATHNFMRKLALDLHGDYGVGFRAAQFPPHMSLKMAFQVADLDAVEAYFDTFAASAQPFDVTLTALEVLPEAAAAGETGIVWLAVQETDTLRALHDRLNAELAERFERTEAAFDGPSYRFHATIAMGGAQHTYQAIAAAHGRGDLGLTVHISQIVLAIADDRQSPPGPFITYKILPLGGG